MEYILETRNLTKVYGRHKAVDSVSLHVRRGDIYGLIGRNGAGKTSVMKMITGLSKPSEGDFSVFGQRGTGSEMYMQRIGALIENTGIYPNMTAYENMKMKSIAMGVRDKKEAANLLKLVGLSDTGRKKVKNFSMGMKQRLGIAMALIGSPDIVILDEPINGLDPQGIAEVRETIERLNRERDMTFIISSHILEELSKISTSYGIINDGVLIREMTREELLAECSERIELKTDDTARACAVLDSMGIENYKVTDASTVNIFERLDGSGDITMALAQAGVKTLGITVRNEGLEDYYLSLTGGAKNV